jgi:hypothetical protein
MREVLKAHLIGQRVQRFLRPRSRQLGDPFAHELTRAEYAKVVLHDFLQARDAMAPPAHPALAH